MNQHRERSKLTRRAPAGRLPFVFLNVAMTADGKIAPTDRRFVPFTSRHDQQLMLELRARADAVMSGARTVDAGPVTLGAGPKRYQELRERRGLSRQPVRVIVSGSGSINPQAAIFQHRFSPIIILTTGRAPASRVNTLLALADEVLVCGERELDFAQALRWLRRKWKIERLLCEGGGAVNGALFQAGLVDELNLTIAPKIMGGREAPTIADGRGVKTLAEAAKMKFKSCQRVGDEMFLVLQRATGKQGNQT